jgi:ABC-type branched-chain amino acid transport systems, periplasmic component
MVRRRVTVMIACGVMALSAACSIGDPSPPASRSTATASPDPLGTVTIAPGQPIVLGTLFASSGPAADLGVDSLRGVKLALDYLDLAFDGTPGTLMGHPVVLASQDDGCAESGGIRGAHALAQDSQVLAVIGPTCSASALGGSVQILSNAGIVTISPSATNPKLTDPTQHAPLFLRTIYNGLSEGAAAADFVYGSLKARRAATAYEAEPQGDAATTGFRDRFEQLGGIIAPGSFALPVDPAKLPSLLQQTVGGGRTDALYTTSVGERCANLTHDWSSMSGSATTAFVGGSGCMVTSVITSGGQGVSTDVPPRPLYVVGPDLTRFGQSSFYRTQFLPAYDKQFGTAPIGPYHAYAFDATDVLLDAIQGVATRYDDGTITIGRTALRDAVFATKDYVGLTGTLSCTPTGECSTDPALAVYQLPAVPLEGGDPSAKPVFSESVSLQTLEASPSP